MAGEEQEQKGDGVLDRLRRALAPQHQASTAANVAEDGLKLVPPEDLKFVPSSDFPNLDPNADTIVISRITDTPYLSSHPLGVRLELPTDAMREELDGPNARIDNERTKFLANAIYLMTYPYVDLYRRMIPLSGSGWRQHSVKRTDHKPYPDIKMAYETTVEYSKRKDGRKLQRARVYLGNNVDDVSGYNKKRPSPELVMEFDGNRMTSISLDVTTQRKALKILVSESDLGSLQEAKYYNDQYWGYRIKLKLGDELGIEISKPGSGQISNFSWEPRQKSFIEFESGQKFSQAYILKLLRDFLALIPTIEKGRFEFEKGQTGRINLKSWGEIIEEVEKMDVPSHEQFETLLRLADKDERKEYARVGLLDEGRP